MCIRDRYTPEATHELETGTASDAGRPSDPPAGEEGIEAPPAKTRRPEGMPEAEEGPGTYQPAPVEDDQLRRSGWPGVGHRDRCGHK